MADNAENIALAEPAAAAPAIGSSAMVVLSRMGERVTRVEAQLEGLKEDTQVTRSSIHAINQEITKIVIIEERCQMALTNLATDFSAWAWEHLQLKP